MFSICFFECLKPCGVLVITIFAAKHTHIMAVAVLCIDVINLVERTYMQTISKNNFKRNKTFFVPDRNSVAETISIYLDSLLLIDSFAEEIRIFIPMG